MTKTTTMTKPVTTTLLTHALAALALATASAPALSQTANLNGWTAAGDVAVDSPTAARLSTAAVDSGELPLTATSALQYFDLEPALALAGGSLPADTFEGSGLAQSFTALAGVTLSFNWTLATQDFDGTQIDRAFVVIDGSSLALLAPVAANTASGLFSHTFNTAGNHALAILVMDVDTADRISTLTISGLQVTAVPEPGAGALMLAGLAGCGLLHRRRGRA